VEHQTTPSERRRAAELFAASVDARMSVVLRIEWTLLAGRYIALFTLVGFYAAGVTPPYSPDLRWLTIAYMAQNALAHWALYTGRYSFFVSPWNFALYLINATITVGLTGAEESPLALLLAVPVIGYCIYAPQFLSTFLVTLICCAAYAFMVLIKWLFTGVNLTSPPIGLHLAGILLCGWLMGSLGELLRRLTLEAQNQTLALASSQATLRAILDNTAEPIVVYDSDEFITDVNDQAGEFLGLPRRDILRRRFRSFVFDDGTLPNKLAIVRSRGEYHGEVLIMTTQGEERSVDLLVRSFIRDGQRFFVAMFHDITRQKSLQETSRLAHLKLEQVNRELQKINEIRTAFVRALSQRLRSPLSAILGFADLMLSEELGELNVEQRKALQSCRRSVLRIFGVLDEPADAEPVSSASAPTTPNNGGENTRSASPV